MKKTHRVQFPPDNVRELDQDEVYFYLREGPEKRRIRLHDYHEIYKIPGLYEQVIYDRLKCQSPSKVSEILQEALSQSRQNMSELRVLDFGAGNGMMGEELKKQGVARLVGADITPEAEIALERDRPGIYDAYYVLDFNQLSQEELEELHAWSFNCLTTVAALGFGDIPVNAFVQALNLIEEDGWVTFNIKETFLDRSDRTGFSKFIRELIFSEYLDVYYLERYRHRLSVEGQPLFYFALAGRKNGHVDKKFVDSLELPA